MHFQARPRPPDLAAFLFDLDGTLVRTPIDFVAMKRRVLELAEDCGLDARALEQYDILGVVDKAELELHGRNRDVTLPFSLREAAEHELTRFEMEAATVAEELPGAIEALTQLKERGRRTAIVTRNCRRAVLHTLDRVPLPHDLLLTRDDVPRVKPDPEHLRAAVRAFGLSPAQCAMVGDHPMDIQAGRAAGMYAIGVRSRDPSPEAFQSVEPDLILTSIADLLPWISASSL